jgi:hypothetical protein
MTSTEGSAVVLPQKQPSPEQVPDALTDELIALAGTPDDSSGIDAKLVTIARLVAEFVRPVSYASVTVHRNGGYTTVAASSDIAVAVDMAQYADRSGPCLAAFESASPVAVPEIATTMTWPGFRDAAYGLGLRASLSIPVFAGRGVPIAALNLYGHDPATMAPLIAAVWAACDGKDSDETLEGHDVDAGGAALVAGLLGAFVTQAVIQQAIGMVIAETGETADQAYLTLRLRAADNGVALTDAASAVLAAHRA